MTVPADPVDPLIERFRDTSLARNGMPDERLRADRLRCLKAIGSVLGDDLPVDGVGASPLGVEWTEVFVVHPRRLPEHGRLTGAGWVPLDPLLGGQGTGRRWAVVEDGVVLGGVRFVEEPPDPVTSVLDGCRERSEVRLREVLELRRLSREGHAFPATAGSLRAAAEIESALGGRLLAQFASGRTASPPVRLPGRRRPLVIAISGVDGSGKSTLRAALADSLDRAGVPVSTVWVRPGMGLGRLTALAHWAKRRLGQDTAPGVRAMADPTAARPVSRRGATGYAWSLLVCWSFLVGVWRQHRAAHGVVLYDRHLVDALATLDFAYEGVDLRLQHRLVRALLPRADVRVYLDVTAEVSVARKPDDVLGEHAVRSQLAAYARWLDRLPPSVTLDATRPTADLVAEVLGLVTARANTDHKRPGSR